MIGQDELLYLQPIGVVVRQWKAAKADIEGIFAYREKKLREIFT